MRPTPFWLPATDVDRGPPVGVRRLAALRQPGYKLGMNIASNGGAAAALELVVAAAENDVIGRGNQLPWHLPADLRHFKSLTLGKPVLMGRKTYESIGKALPGRTNIVLSRSAAFTPRDCIVVRTLEEARAAAGAQPLMVIGGADIYRQCLPFASRIHLTLIHARIDGDTLFAAWRGAEWDASSCERHEPDDKNAYAYSFITLERRGSGRVSEAAPTSR
jgi:dihydrofolate reductase